MKKILLILLCLSGFVYMGSCTNDEGGNDLDVVTPGDTTESVIPTRL